MIDELHTSVKKPEGERDHLEDVVLDEGRKRILKKKKGRNVWTRFGSV
jgi:hypothetical protein